MTYSAILKMIEQEGYFNHHDRVLVAVSGGIDSMNLLHFLYTYRQQLTIDIGIAHVNHHQRSSSLEEQEYLETWAKEHEVPIYISHFKGHFTEKNGREFRYCFFRQVMQEHAYTALVTAHHANDHIETILMRLIRGSRLRQLVGISAVTKIPEGELIRPFLLLKKNDLASIFHFEDESNLSLTYFRNRVRHHYLPLLETENPKLQEHLLHFSQDLHLLLEAMAELTKDMTCEHRADFLKQPISVQVYLFQEYLQQFPDLQLTKSHFNQVLDVIRYKTNTEMYLKSGYWLILTRDRMTISKISPKTDEATISQVLEYNETVFYEGFTFSFMVETADQDGIALLDLSPILLRSPQSGDRLDIGPYAKKIRRLFIDDKISFEDRRNAVVGEQAGHILFVIAGDKTYLRKLNKHDTIKARLYIQKEAW